ncbi:sensor histidine kinase [Luteococcus sp. Sow4_B9]|uniref:sensor histidine kinase n=1 Tax=Luteococcus sp. Sow4_B9 TaxID=3438792 RepID=UPI003F9B55A2
MVGDAAAARTNTQSHPRLRRTLGRLLARLDRNWRDIPGRTPAGPAEAAVLRSLSLTAIGVWLLLIPGALYTLLSQEIQHPTNAIIGLSLVIFHHLLMVPVLLKRCFSRDVLVATAIPLFVGVAAMMPWRSTIYPENFWAPGFWSLPWAMTAVIVLNRREYLITLTTLFPGIAVADVAVQYLVGAPVDRWAMEPIPGIVLIVATLVLFADGLLQMARRSDASTERTAEAEEERGNAASQAEAKREAARLLHDHVLHALHALSRDANLPQHMAAEECESAVAAMSAHMTPDVEPAVDLAELIASDAALGQVNATLIGSAPRLPQHVARALADATHEALGNVKNHAHASECVVEISHHGQQWTCTIMDNGRGFDPMSVPQGRLGVRRSIGERLREVGGRAAITSAIGRGTTVELTWPSLDEPPSLSSADPAGQARQVLSRTAWPNLAMVPVFTLILLPLANPQWPVAIAAAVVTLSGAWQIHRLRKHPLTEIDSAVLLGISMAAWATNLMCVPNDVETVHYLWLSWGCASLLQLVMLQMRLRTALLIAAAWTGAMTLLMVARLGWQLPWEYLHPVISVGLGEGFFGLAALHLGRWIAEREATQKHIQHTLHHESNRISARNHLDQYWSSRVTGEALPLLRDVAEGRRLSSDPDLRRQAELIEATLRDELMLGPDAHNLLAALADRRAEGWRMISTLNQENTHSQLETAAMVLHHMGPPKHVMQQMTLSASSNQISVVVLAPNPTQRERWASQFVDVVADDEFARIVLSLPNGAGPRRAAPLSTSDAASTPRHEL